MERVIFKYLYHYFNKHDLFYKYQAGFLPGHSTVYQLLENYQSIVSKHRWGWILLYDFFWWSVLWRRVLSWWKWHWGRRWCYCPVFFKHLYEKRPCTISANFLRGSVDGFFFFWTYIFTFKGIIQWMLLSFFFKVKHKTTRYTTCWNIQLRKIKKNLRFLSS